MQGYNPDLTGPAGVVDTKGNPELARQLLQQGLREEGWSQVGQIPTIRLNYIQGNDEFVKMVIQQWQSVLGVRVEADSVKDDPASIGRFRQEQGSLQLWWDGWLADYPDPQDWTTLQFGKNSPQNFVHYGQNAEQQQVQQELEAADVKPDLAMRLRAYNDAEQQLINDVAWLPIYQEVRLYLLKPYVQGLKINALELTPPDDWARVSIAAH